ncbi:NAD-P-binding protein [Lentinus tigrinus ALCF2SS1-7]|uniref:NAD-P-binding protein n=1 Tax=Lentinus tigrinus ALCF2SS1-6 TaxID=1328759 RepID=A0A5C2RV54_9APHY|nr:NAD-P-binding protein [Lentinus tigrinus ALCF2SS1-6]RPD69338.1 NAD-P-binding protein [Lentinus tigrinus ALCF2SS1-7]
MTSYAIIGASRGIGLEYVRQLAAKPGSTVFAVVRNAAKSIHLQAATKTLKNVHVLEADVVDYPSLQKAAKEIGEVTGGKLDCLIHNAARMDAEYITKGFDHYASMDELDADFITSYKINALGVIHSISAFLPLLRAGPTKKIVVVSTAGADPKFVRAAGIADMTAYGMTKAAALIATTKWAIKLQNEGFIVVSVSPGLVDTTGTIGEHGDPATQALVLGAAEAMTQRGIPVRAETPEESVSAQVKLLDGLQPSDNGSFMVHSGGEFNLDQLSIGK